MALHHMLAVGMQAIYEAEERPTYPVFDCSDAVDAQQMALQAQALSAAHPWPPLVQVLAAAVVERYTPSGHCTTAALQQAELNYAGQLAQVAYEQQVRASLASVSELHGNVYNFTV
jgi:hypothetical protein